MRRLLSWAREVDWLAVLAIVLLVAAVSVAIVAIYLPAYAALAFVLGFGSLTLAFLTK